MGETNELLFFDTFAHDNSEELSLDLVQFPRPVYVNEIRIIPLGARVQSDFPGGHRLGATNPSSFKLEFFLNDLSKRGACTFEKIGSLDYRENVNIQFLFPNKIPTDGLVIRGCFTLVTVAIYGVLTKVTKERVLSPPPPPQCTSRTPVESLSPVSYEPSNNDHKWERPTRAEILDAAPPPPPPPSIPIHPHHNPEPLRGYSESQNPHGDGRRLYSEPNPQYPEHHPPLSNPPVPPPPVTTNTRTPYKYENYPKPWPEEPYHKKHEPYEHPNYESSEGHSYHSRGAQHWEKPIDARESGDFLREKDKAHEFPDDRRTLLKDPKRREHHEPVEAYGREAEWAKDRTREGDKDHARHIVRDSRLGPQQSREPSRERKGDFGRRPASPLSPCRTGGQPKTPPPIPEPAKKVRETGEGDECQASGDDMFEPVSPDQSPVDLYNMSDGEIRDLAHLEDEFEEILSEEELMSDGDERNIEMGDLDYDIGDDTWNFTATFNPFQCELTELQYFKDPGWSTFEINQDKVKEIEDDVTLFSEDAQKLVQLLKQFTDKEYNEKWVETVEVVSTLIGSYGTIPKGPTFDCVTKVLLEWLAEGLNYESAASQAQTPFKVRHLKAGVKLATALLETSDWLVELLLKQGAVKQLMDMYSMPYMSLPLKLLIIRALDAATFTLPGLEYFFNCKVLFTSKHCQSFKSHDDLDSKEDEGGSDEKWMTCYARLWEILMVKEPTRAVVALQSLVNKLHVYEVLLDLKENIDKITQTFPSVDGNEKSGSEMETDSPNQSMMETGGSSSVMEKHSVNIVCCLRELAKMYSKANKLIAQLLRFLPATVHFENPQIMSDPYPGLYRMFRDCKLLECVFVIVSSSIMSGQSGVVSALRDLLSHFLLKNSGLKFLMQSPQVINGIHRALFQAADDNREDSGDENIANQLGLSLVCALQALQHVDSLFAYHHVRPANRKDFDDPEAVSSLHSLYLMWLGVIGKMSVVNVISMENNLDALIPFIELTNIEEHDVMQSKSAGCGYATELLLLTVHHSESIDLIRNFGEHLVALSQQAAKLNELSRWMCPVKKPISFSHESVSYLMTSYVKKFANDISELPPELVTALRILEHVVIPSNGLKEDESELKYKYGMLQLFANDALEHFITILQLTTENFLKPTPYSLSLVGQQGSLVLATVKPVVSMLHVMLAHLIRCRGTEFKDLTAVPPFLKLHTLLCLFPMSSYVYPVAQQVQNEIIETLLCYTQPILGKAESEEVVSKSLWTRMVSEVLKYTVVAPNTWMTGLTILSELLPLPLPLQTKEALSSEEICMAVNSRKLWSAHLHSLNAQLEQVIVSMAATSCQPLQQLLRRICVQLADLAAPTSIVVVRAVLDVLEESIPWNPPPPVVDPVKDEKPVLEITHCSPCTSRILDFLSYMVSNATFKITLLHILSGNLKTTGKYENVMYKMTTLLNLPSSNSSHQHGQENIVSIFQSLCDPEIGLVTLESGSTVLEVLGNSLPHRDLLSQMVTALVAHIGDHCHPFASVLPSLRTLVMLTEHDLGVVTLKVSLEANPTAFSSLLRRLGNSFSKVSSDCLSTLSTAIELLRLLVQGYDEPTPPPNGLRTLNLTSAELVPILQWKPVTRDSAGSEASDATVKKDPEDVKTEVQDPVKDLTQHPLLQLEKQLTECLNDEDVLESLLESLQGIISTLNDGMNKEIPEKGEIPEQVLPSADSLAGQFSSRTVFIVGDVDEERLSPSYWLSLLGVEDADQDLEQVQTDLLALSEKYCVDFDLKSGLQKLCFVLDDKGSDVKKKVDSSSGKRHYAAGSTSADGPIKKPFTAPMRGRGFSRGGMHNARANDPFRSRPPNTSRPPSMHVDDFLAMEYQGPSPSSLAGLPKRPVKEVPRGRGRGGFESNRGFVAPRGSRFFSPPSSTYSRRETSRAPFPSFPFEAAPRVTARTLSSPWAGRSAPLSLSKSQIGLHSFGRGSHSDRGSGSQRPRDPYTLVNTPSSSAARFGRSARSVTSVSNMEGGLSTQSHWMDPRLKMQDARFIQQSSAVRGRRDIMSRHARSFTR